MLRLGGITDALKGINGNFELNRLVGAFGGLVYIIAANVFVGYEVFYLSKDFDVTAYCLAFPGGLAVIAGGTAGAIAWKDKGVASARITEQTGSKPATPPNPAPKKQPELDQPGEPKPVAEEANL